MAKKAYRELSEAERKHHSLSARVSRYVVIGAAILGVTMLIIGLTLYSVAVSNQYISTSFNLCRSASKVLSELAETEALSGAVMERYNSMSDAERAEVGTEAYDARYSDLIARDDYQDMRALLAFFLESSDVYDIYLGMYDREHSALVYIADPSEEDVALPGYWESVEPAEAEKFLNWDGTGTLYDISNMEKYGWICSAGVPLKNAAGETFAFVLADITLGHVLPKLAMFTLQYTVALAVLILAFGWFMLRYMNRNIVKPINDIAQAAQTYVRDKREDAQTNNHFARLDIRTGDEIENLSIVMSQMEEDLVAYEDNLTKVTAEKQRIGTELELATRIQADMLPNIFPAFPERQEFTIYASMTPAKEVGGDFYDFFFVDQDRLAMVIADVSGKGIPAAMFMMMAKSMIQTQAASGRGPREVLETVNHLICQNNREEMFVTVWFAILDLNTGILTAANAGHEFPILKKPGGCFEIFKDKHGFVIGGMDGVKYREYEIRLEPGARLFVYTDGVAEATSADKELFGMDRAVQALNDAADQSPEGLLRAVNAAVSRFVGDAEQFDDLTMLCIEYKGKEENR